MSFAKSLVLLLSLSATVQSLTTPIVLHARHHAIAARVAAPALLDIPPPPLARRQTSRRCKQRPVSSSSVHPSSSSVPVVAIKATPQAPEPTTTPKYTPQPTTSHAAPAATTPASNSGGSQPSFMVGTQTGQGTFYSTGLGACGITNTDSDFIAAASHLLFDNFPDYNHVNPNKNPICGRTVTAHYQGKTVTVAITDRCAACGQTDLDFSPSAFNKLADFSVGRISGMTWTWN